MSNRYGDGVELFVILEKPMKEKKRVRLVQVEKERIIEKQKLK